ncbi:MAG: hypothetical protein ACXU8O_07475, partial [Asticcacaulis sp.]
LAVIVLLIALIGMVVALFSGPSDGGDRRVARKDNFNDPFDAPRAGLSETVAPAEAMTVTGDSRGGSLKFEAPEIVPLIAEPAHEMTSLEPAVFHDNASDSFLSQFPQGNAVAESPQPPLEASFQPDAALADTHGLHVRTGADIVPIRPDISNPALAPATPETAAQIVHHDPVEAALLAETPHFAQAAPQSDMNAVVSSAMSFIGAPEPDPVASAPEPLTPQPQPVAVAAEPAAAPPPPAIDDQAEIRQAVATALSVWPDSTRGIAADEVGGRIAHLYYSRAPEDAKAFHLIAQGDLNAAAATLQKRAETLAMQGFNAEAAEMWRIYGALHMGRDDARAMMAYEHVSALDLSDANIHLYLSRRYAMSGDTARQPAVLGRALAVISDPATRVELLTPYAEQKMKAGDYAAAGDAFEELAKLQEQSAAAKPGDVAAKSAYAIAFARAAQSRELANDFGRAGPLYKRAHQTFAELSAQVPDHAGLKAMADNAANDARRFNMA